MGIAFFNDSPGAAKSHVVRGILARVERAPPPSRTRRSKNRHVQDNRRKEFTGSFRFTRSPPSPPALSGLSVWISWSRFIPPGGSPTWSRSSTICGNARARINLFALTDFLRAARAFSHGSGVRTNPCWRSRRTLRGHRESRLSKYRCIKSVVAAR